MKDFFSSTRFKILLGVAIVLCAFMLRAAWTGGFGTITSSVIGAVVTPLQQAAAGVSDSVNRFFSTFVRAGELETENIGLKEEIRLLNEKLVDYDKIKHQNEVYNDLWEIRDHFQALEFVPAQVVGRDASDRFYSFNIDKGTLDGISVRDTVTTPAGLVGVVTEVGLTYAKVSTILDPSVNISVYGTRTRDTGVIGGTVELAEQGLCKMSYLPRESGAAIGDLVVTSGVSGRYPKDQIVGTITEVSPESHGNSLYAVIKPSADIKTIQDVLVIKSFEGEGDNHEAEDALGEEQSSRPEESAPQGEAADGGEPAQESAGDLP